MAKTLVARNCSPGRQPGILITSPNLISTAGEIFSPGWQDHFFHTTFPIIEGNAGVA
jgi:hypothetical protein